MNFKILSETLNKIQITHDTQYQHDEVLLAIVTIAKSTLSC